jgi:hypothetical protein
VAIVEVLEESQPYPHLRNVEHEIRRAAYSPAFDAFGRARISEPVTLFDATMQYDLQDALFETVTAGGGSVAHVPHQSAASLTVGTASGDRVVRQSRRYLRYSPGKSHLVLQTGTLGTAVENTTQRIGYFDDENGLFIEQTGDGLNLVQRSYTTGEVVEERIAQADWNLDPMNGTGMSGLTLDPATANIYGWAIEWLGVGVTTAFAVINGAIWPLHRFYNANAKPGVYMTTATLPVRYEIVNTGDSAGASMTQICSTVISEGGRSSASASSHVAGNGTTTRTVTSSVPLPIVAIRPGLTFEGVTNRITTLPSGVDIYTGSAQDAPLYWQLVRGGTTLGGSWGTADALSCMEVNTSGTAITGGQVIAAGYDRPSAGVPTLDLAAIVAQELYLTVDAAGTASTELALVGQAFSTNVAASATITWLEAK